MDILNELEQVSRDVSRLTALLDRPDLQGDPAAPILQALRAELEKHLAEAREIAPKALAELDQMEDETLATLEQAQANLAEAQQSIAAFGSKPTVEPLTELSIAEGRGLAAELRKRYGVHKAAATMVPGASMEEVAALPSGEFARDTVPASKAPMPGPAIPPHHSPPPKPIERPSARDAGSISSVDFNDDE